VELVLDEASLQHIRGLFARHNREMPERNRLQAMFPQGSRPIFNPRGTAPGIDLAAPRAAGGLCRVFALPGVPAEMFEMFAQSVAPAVQALQPDRKLIRHRRVKCFGAGESQIEQMLPDLIRRGRDPSVGITVSAATITLRVTAEGATAAECEARMQPTIDTIRQCLGNLVFGDEDDELQDVVVRRLASDGRRVAVVDAGSEGQLAATLLEASRELFQRERNAFDVFAGGLTLGDLRAAAILGLDPTAWAGRDPASDESFVRAAAAACRQRFAADYALAIGFFPAQELHQASAQRSASAGPAPEYHFALATPTKVTCHAATLISHPAIWKPRAAKQALNLLRLSLPPSG
jgi:nicotinamide-nucleotide amidase